MRITINQLRRIIREELIRETPEQKMKNLILPNQILDLAKNAKDADTKNALLAVRKYMIQNVDPDPQVSMNFQHIVGNNKNLQSIVKTIEKYYPGFKETFGID